MTDQMTLDAMLERIAELAVIAPGKRRGFKDAAFFVLAFAEWSESGYRNGITPRDRKTLRAIAKAAFALDVALQRRTPRTESALAAEWLARQDADGTRAAAASRAAFSRWLASPRLLADLANRAQSPEMKRRPRGKRGAPAGFRSQIAYELAVNLRKAAADHGGKLGIDKTLGAGPLLTALELCKPFLASSFQLPSAMTLARMIKKQAAPPTAARNPRSKNRKSTAKKRTS